MNSHEAQTKAINKKTNQRSYLYNHQKQITFKAINYNTWSASNQTRLLVIKYPPFFQKQIEKFRSEQEIEGTHPPERHAAALLWSPNTERDRRGERARKEETLRRDSEDMNK